MVCAVNVTFINITMIKKLHMTWAQGVSNLPEKFLNNIQAWKNFLPDWEIIVWDIESASKQWDDFSKFQERCAHHATRSDLIQSRVLRDIGGLYIGTDAAPLNNIYQYINILNTITTATIVVDFRHSIVMNCLAYSVGNNNDFWDSVAHHQLRGDGSVLSNSNVHWATGPGCISEVFFNGDYNLVAISAKQAYSYNWLDSWSYNTNAYIDPGYASSWHS
jgi:mannosyltransferase OCH1-like enzyme